MRADGFICDVCRHFEFSVKGSNTPTMPDGWISVHPKVNATAPTSASSEPLQVCSNRCLAELAIRRWENEPENEGKRFIRSRELKHGPA